MSTDGVQDGLAAPQEALVQDRLKARFDETLATIPSEVERAVQAVAMGELDDRVMTTVMALRNERRDKLVVRDAAPDETLPVVPERRTTQMNVLKAIMNGDLTGPSEEAKSIFEEMAILGASSIATHPVIVGAQDTGYDFDLGKKGDFTDEVKDLAESLAEVFAPYAAIAMVTNKRLYNEGQQYGLESAFKNQNTNLLGSLMESYFETCLVGTTAPLILRPGFESVETEKANREAFLRFCLKYYVGTYLKKLLSEYLNLLLEEKIRAKEKELPINFGDMAKALSMTIQNTFQEFRRQ